MVQAARGKALAAVNTALVDLYWRIGEYIAAKLETAAWGEGVVEGPRSLPGAPLRGPPGLHSPQPVPDAAVLRGVQEPQESLKHRW